MLKKWIMIFKKMLTHDPNDQKHIQKTSLQYLTCALPDELFLSTCFLTTTWYLIKLIDGPRGKSMPHASYWGKGSGFRFYLSTVVSYQESPGFDSLPLGTPARLTSPVRRNPGCLVTVAVAGGRFSAAPAFIVFLTTSLLVFVFS